ncbi:hypothetical protein [Mesobacillus zeae]|uniref:Uncharacterized protein n=1 Tax=Mesobacillus zeae TaxID=1917180 RepID=A0A398B756_9BACI|nr:hypothetical protein [Mesobacillus zeae]RID85627.1 hypothetical protein D1970_08715 [Mesobacillus zeae]
MIQCNECKKKFPPKYLEKEYDQGIIESYIQEKPSLNGLMESKGNNPLLFLLYRDKILPILSRVYR